MKILIVTDQLLYIKEDKILGTLGFTNTIKRLSAVGEIHLCVRDATTARSNILVYNDVLNSYVAKEHVSFIPKSFIWPSRKTIKIMQREIKKVDLVIGYVPSLNAEVASTISHKLGKKYLAFMVACPWDGLWNQDWKRKIAAPYRYLLNKSVLRHADYALYVTERFLQDRYPTQAAKSLGLSDVVLEPSNPDLLKARIEKINLRKPSQIIKIGTVAMLNIKYKGQRFVIKALKELKDRGLTNYKYVMIGGGDETYLRNLATKLGVIDQVEFTGKVTHDKVFKLLDDIDIYVHPSLQEGLPRSVVEAMSRALPCIGAATGAIPELLDNNFVVKRKSSHEIAEKLILLNDSRIMREEAIRNYEKAKEFECETLDAKRNDFYQSIANDFQS